MALVATLTVTALAGSSARAGLAFAQQPTSPAPHPAPCYGCRRWGMRGGWAAASAWPWPGIGLIHTLAQLTTELEPAHLYAQLQQGKTLLEIAKAHGLSAKQLVKTALASRAKVLQQHLEP